MKQFFIKKFHTRGRFRRTIARRVFRLFFLKETRCRSKKKINAFLRDRTVTFRTPIAHLKNTRVGSFAWMQKIRRTKKRLDFFTRAVDFAVWIPSAKKSEMRTSETLGERPVEILTARVGVSSKRSGRNSPGDTTTRSLFFFFCINGFRARGVKWWRRTDRGDYAVF